MTLKNISKCVQMCKNQTNTYQRQTKDLDNVNIVLCHISYKMNHDHAQQVNVT